VALLVDKKVLFAFIGVNQDAELSRISQSFGEYDHCGRKCQYSLPGNRLYGGAHKKGNRHKSSQSEEKLAYLRLPTVVSDRRWLLERLVCSVSFVDAHVFQETCQVKKKKKKKKK